MERETPIPKPRDRLINTDPTPETHNPQNPHFFHLNRAIAQMRLIMAKRPKSGNVQPGASGKASVLFVSRIFSAPSALAMIIKISHAVKHPCLRFPGVIASSFLSENAFFNVPAQRRQATR